MNPLTEAEVEDLLAGYALDALTAEEAGQMEAHLRQCSQHQQAAAELRQTATRLALAVDDQEPPARLRQRVAEAARAASQEGPARAATSDARLPLRMPAQPSIWRRWRVQPGQLVAAAAVIIALGVGTLFGTRIAAPQQQTWSFAGNQLAPGAHATLVYDRDRHTAVLAVTGLPALGPGQLYQVWLIEKNAPVDAGVSGQAGGNLLVRISKDPTQYQTLAITIEPGEQTQPTTTPILAGTLR
ncbi:MAG TPA: anti-sigma factor [Candidatus Acidoferrum sp.]|nr:anti-sigma factor [Candidatus Acidoferrum sp.]